MRYNDFPRPDRWDRHAGYQEGVDRVIGYVKSIHPRPGLDKELEWAISEGII